MDKPVRPLATKIIITGVVVLALVAAFVIVKYFPDFNILIFIGVGLFILGVMVKAFEGEGWLPKGHDPSETFWEDAVSDLEREEETPPG